ncbi:hydantoinase B/oxoprolinase family protein [Nostoc sp. FACHB-280]|uniref:hydantoinase B/oxoprolinase family protein n=1 Tax=Nostoc sp. FACHB-280 TaxID=2692839 RepID=UPI00168B196B|nr:hydantoinase B/oxoprolinase family protein [Nostoc sp. FACHB-280]MBD2494741.1 hydantoinase B/oxoprolinase family protein [Nostoc sp. FACHB-280]
MNGASLSAASWEFWIDRGGTFTDIVAKRPDDQLIIHKLLSENPEQYTDAAVQGIREILGLAADAPIPADRIAAIKMGTTVATNALLERKGDRTVLVITQGFRDALRIGYQNRPDIFARQIILPEMLYERVIEVEERYSAQGEELILLNLDAVRPQLQAAYNDGIRCCAIAFMHGYRYTTHEQQVASLANSIGFTQISISHQVSPLMKLVSRGDTTVVDAYLSPILRRYVDQVSHQLSSATHKGQTTKLMFMQSNGGLADAENFQGKDSILSGPAGGIVGAVQTSQMAGFDKIISFDMGGTSTDVAHYNGEYERTFETEVAGVRLRTPMMAIHTVAAGGGSIVQFDGSRYRVGPESAGANPGPAAYSKGGPLTVTDCNVMVGKLQPEFFPKVFGANGNLPLNVEVVRQKFQQLAAEIGDGRTPEEVATGFLAIAVDKMANAIKKISLQRGYDVSEYTLCCFGGAGGQHACLIADALGMQQVFIHPYAGVLSAYGMGLADVRVIREKSVEAVLSEGLLEELELEFVGLVAEAVGETNRQGAEGAEGGETTSLHPDTLTPSLEIYRKVHLKYEGTDAPLIVDFADVAMMQCQFEELHRQRYGFIAAEKQLIVEAVAVEVVEKHDAPEEAVITRRDNKEPVAVATIQMYTAGLWQTTPVYQRQDLQPGDCIAGPAIIVEATGTNVIEPHWQAELTARNHLALSTVGVAQNKEQMTNDRGQKPDPVMLEIFNNLFRAIAEQMGITLQNTSSSVNIKERLDFSCAIFDGAGQLVANAPHIPVHLGSMSESVQALIANYGETIKPGDVFVSNNPYNGGTHLPDITVITPVFPHSRLVSGLVLSAAEAVEPRPLFYVASRGHHADIGGITPGSMPPNSTNVIEEGILIDNFQLVAAGKFREPELVSLLTSEPYPARNIPQNLADLKAQIAANERGVQELLKMVDHYGLETVQAYMNFVQDNAEESVRRVIEVLKDGSFSYALDDGSVIQVAITINQENHSAKIDFTGTSSQQLTNNFNAPAAVCKAAVLYVFRTLVNDDIPLNAGCLKPLEIHIPEGCMLNPAYPAAVVAGNVETSQAITDALYGALGVLAASQGTMNNFTFGNERYQYYETICGGSGAGRDFDGTDAVHTHMTNSRLTDPEVLEWRFPIVLENFAIRENSGGQGYHHGGNGVIRRLRFLEPMTAAILSNYRIVAPFGLCGGASGEVGRNYVARCDGTVEDLGSKAVVEMNINDVFVIETPGGGGYGFTDHQ